MRDSKMSRLIRLSAVVGGCLLLFGSGVARATPVEAFVGPAGSVDTIVDWSGQADDEDTGIRVQNLSPNPATVSIDLQPETANYNLIVPDRFLLLDHTLNVTSTLPAGERLLRVRMDYGRRYGRAGIRAMGIRANSIRLLRADFASGRWIRAITGIRDLANADIRFLTGIRANLVLGHHGLDQQNEFAWAVLDTSGDQYFTLGGLSEIPLPAAWLLFLSGSGLLALIGRRRTRAEP